MIVAEKNSFYEERTRPYSPCSPRGTGAARPASASTAPPAGHGRHEPLERVADLGAHSRRSDEQHDGVDEELGVDDHVANQDGELWQEPSPRKMLFIKNIVRAETLFYVNGSIYFVSTGWSNRF